MQRHRDNGVRAGKHVGAGPHHERAERRSQEPPPAVLERVNNLSKRSVVSTRAARQREDRGLPPAARAQRVGRAPRGERIAAPDATGRRQPRHRAPTRVAHRTRQWTVEHCRARGAERLEKNANERVGCRDEHDAGRTSGVQARGQRSVAKTAGIQRGIAETAIGGVIGGLREVRYPEPTEPTEPRNQAALQSSPRPPTAARARRTRACSAGTRGR